MTAPDTKSEDAKIAAIKVLSGNHAGATYLCSKGVYAIGNSFDDHIILTDTAVRPSHVKLSITRDLVGLGGVAGPVQIAGRTLGKEDSVTRRYPVELSIGGSDLRISRLNDSLFTTNRLVAAAALLTLAAGGTLFDVHSSHSSAQNASASRQAAAGTNSASSDTKHEEASLSPSNELVKRVANQFSDYLLKHDLTPVTLSANSSTVIAKGAITEADKDRWRDAQIWFDTNFGQRVPLISEMAVVARKEEAAPIRVQAVWAGANPYVMDSNGNKYFEGSVLHNGWSIEKIEQSRITLQRNNDRLVLRL